MTTTMTRARPYRPAVLPDEPSVDAGRRAVPVPSWALVDQDRDEPDVTWLPLPGLDRHHRPLGVLVVRCPDRWPSPRTAYRARLFAGTELVGYAKLFAPRHGPAREDRPTVCDVEIRPSARGQALSAVLLTALRDFFGSDLWCTPTAGDERCTVLDWLTGFVVE